MKAFFALLGLSVLAMNVQAETHHVEIKKYKFIPQHIEINAGDTVVWTNKEKRQYHSVWFKSLNPEEPEYVFPDETVTMTFNDAGELNYECGPHPEMTGSVSVVK
ncbi:cupredoxin domain-containing protein [Litoribrevibacter albus]|uniref:EfeO-type cupredoxin-like domain-containing protein n=1 Tax=Litoribrevibacter albus TaxID=1473156 RepID=A0AA37W555_9GAMM|nr:cupredoxin domain-containing protein [Litoribrevibacter albus]GLQ30852.1 hypothetical protein GCM10007876_13310 [Litoribrevibacter albus]